MKTILDRRMKQLFKSCAVLATLGSQSAAQETSPTDPVRQPEPAAYFSMTNLGGAFDFDETDWRAAVARAGTRIYWKIDRDETMAARVNEVAASVTGDPPFAALYAVNLRPDQAATFDQLLDQLTSKDAGGDFAGAEFIMKEPLCRLLRLPENNTNGIREHYLATLQRSEERRSCYSLMIAYVLANPQDFQPPPLERIVLDSAAVMTQTLLPPVAMKEEQFINVDTWQNDRRAVPRDGGAVFAAGELMLLNVVLENVGRDMVGTPLATYEIKLDLEIRDAEGNVIANQNDAMRFSGSAIHSVPIRPDYFETGVVAGFPLDLLGDYQIRYRLTDMNRPEDGAVVEIVKQVTIR